MIYKGYIKTKNKKAVEKIKGREEFKNYSQVEELEEFAGVLAEDTILIDIDDFKESEILFNIVKELGLKCIVYKTTRGKHFIFKKVGVKSNKTHCTTAITLKADIKIGGKNSYQVLKFKGKQREKLLDCEEDEIQMLPKWLRPIKTNMEFLQMKAGDGRNQALYNYILTLQSNDFSVEESKECINIINKYIFQTPLAQKEMEVILRDQAFKKPAFFNGNKFLFNKFAAYMTTNNHIIKINNQLHIYKEGVYVSGQTEIEAEMIKHISSLNKSKRSEVISYLDILIRENKEVTDVNMIAFQNGVLNLENDTFKSFSPEIIITNKINWEYKAEAYSLLVDNTMDKLSCNDKEVRALLEETIGYCLYRRNELGKAFILIGDRANGKSTFLDMIKTLLGDKNIASLDLKELGERFKGAELFGKLANIGDDIGDEFIPDASIFKKLVTGDRINVERKGQDPFDFNNYSKLLFSANNMPRIKDRTGAVLRRLTIIPFEAKFSPEDEDYNPYIKYDLRSKECIEYLILLGIKGLKRVLKNKAFTQCKKAQEELKEYEEINNPIIGFYNEVGIEEIENEPTKDVYKKYLEYCLFSNLKPLSKIEFSRQMTKQFELKIEDKKIGGKKYRIFSIKESNGST